MHTRTI